MFVPMSWPAIISTYLEISCSAHSLSRASHGVWDMTIMSALLSDLSRVSCNKGNGGTPCTISDTCSFMASDHILIWDKSSLPPSTSAASVAFPSLDSLLIQSSRAG